MKRRPTGKQTNKKVAKGLLKEQREEEVHIDDHAQNSPVPSLHHQDEETVETFDQVKLLAEDQANSIVVPTFKSEETLISSSTSTQQQNSKTASKKSSNSSQHDHNSLSVSASASLSSINNNVNADHASSEASIKSVTSKTNSPISSPSVSSASDDENNRDSASVSHSVESERDEINNDLDEGQDDVPLAQIQSALDDDDHDDEESHEGNDDDGDEIRALASSPSVPLSQNAKNLEYRREQQQQLEQEKSRINAKKNRRTINNKLNNSKLNSHNDDDDDHADDDEEDLDEEELLFRHNYFPGSINDARRMRTLMLSSQMKNFDDGLNPCFKRILGFSYEGFVDFADVFRGANVTSATTGTTNNQQPQNSINNNNNNNNKQSTNNNNNINLNEDSAGLSRSASRRRQRDPTNNYKNNSDDFPDTANILNTKTNLIQQNTFTNTNNSNNFERDSHQHSFPENRMKSKTTNTNNAHRDTIFSKNLFDENEEREQEEEKKKIHPLLQYENNNNFHRNHNTGLLRCYEPLVANKRRSGLQQFFSVVATSGGGPHTRVSALGTCEDLVEYSEIRLSLLCECLRHFETFGCFTGLPDRCRVALHFVVCEERELPWNDASGVPLIVSKAADVRLWCLETLSSLIHSTFSILATNSLISRAAAKAIFDDVFLVEGDPNALFSAQFFAAVSKYSALRAAKLLKASLIGNIQTKKNRSFNNKKSEQQPIQVQFDPEHSVLKIDTFSARGIMNTLAQTVLDNPFYMDENNSKNKESSLVRALELLMNSTIAKVESELTKENGAESGVDVENVKSNDYHNKTRTISSSNSSLCDLFISKEPVQQILAILKAGSDFVKRELLPLLVTSCCERTDGGDDDENTFPHHWMPSVATSHGENLVDSVFRQELEKQQGSHDNSTNDSLPLHYKCDKFSDFLNVSYDPIDDNDDGDDIPPQEETETEVDAMSRFGNLLPHAKDPDVLFNLQRIFPVHNNNNNNSAKNIKKKNSSLSTSLLQVAIPSTMITPVSILLDLSSRLNQVYHEMIILPSSSTNTKNKNNFDEFISAIMCPLTHMSSIPFVYNRYINSQGQSKTSENQAVESLKLFIHEELKNKIYSADNSLSQLPAPAFACLASVPKLVVELLMISGRCALYSTSVRSFCLMKHKLKSNRSFFSISSTIQSHRLFSSCVKNLQQKIREEFVVKAVNEIWNENKTELNDDEDSALGSRDENNKNNRDSVEKQVRKMFALFENDSNDINDISTDNRELAIKNVTGEALFMLARDNYGSDKLLITLWE